MRDIKARYDRGIISVIVGERDWQIRCGADYIVLTQKEARWLKKILKKAIAENEKLVLEETVSLEEQLCAVYGELRELLAEYFQK